MRIVRAVVDRVDAAVARLSGRRRVLIDARTPIDHHKLLARALSYWRAQILHRRPYCPNCKANYAEGALPGAFLFSTPAHAPISASVTAYCDACWRDLDLADIERSAERVLSAIIPNGRLEARR